MLNVLGNQRKISINSDGLNPRSRSFKVCGFTPLSETKTNANVVTRTPATRSAPERDRVLVVRHK